MTTESERTAARSVDELRAVNERLVISGVREQLLAEAAEQQRAELSATLDTLTAGVAHEVNNPLVYVLSNVDFALEALPELSRALREAGYAEAATHATKLDEVVRALGEAREGSDRIRKVVRALGRVGRVADAQRSAVEVTEVLRSLGELSVDSTLGHGATHRLVLRPPAQRPAIPPPVSPKRRGAGGGRVMVIDDEPAVGRAIAMMLEREHEIVVLTDARLALSRLAEGAVFDLILCDLMMPTVTGMDFYETLRESNPDAARRMLIVTGGAFSDAADRFLASFPNPVLTKPVDRTVLRRVVSEYVAMAR